MDNIELINIEKDTLSIKYHKATVQIPRKEGNEEYFEDIDVGIIEKFNSEMGIAFSFEYDEDSALTDTEKKEIETFLEKSLL